MKKKLSLIIRHKPVRKILKTEYRTDSPHRDKEQCASAKKYLFSLDEQEETVKNVSLLTQFRSNRKQADISISKWGDKDYKQHQRQNFFETCTSNSLAQQRKHLRLPTDHEGRDEDDFSKRNQQNLKTCNFQLTPKMTQIKFERKKNKAQNLSQLQLTSSINKIPSEQHLASIPNKSNCLKTLQLKLKQQKIRIAHPTKTVGISFFDGSVDQVSIFGNKTEKLHLITNKLNGFCMSQSKTVEKLKQVRENMLTNQRVIRARKKEFDIVFVRHKLRKREGVWMKEVMRDKDLFPSPSRYSIPKDKCK